MKSTPLLQEETLRLDSIADDSWYLRPTNEKMIEYCAKVFGRYIHGGSILELGPAEGVMTRYLSQMGDSLTVVDGAEKFCIRLREQYPQVEVLHSLFEDFRPDRQFDSIVLGHVLEHVLDPVETLRLVQKWLRKPDGQILAAVPNSRSLHRQAAVIMGLLPFEEAMNDADIHHGHRRVFNPETFRNIFSESGLMIKVFGGYWLKPVSNKQIEESWSPDMLSAFMQLGERYPDIAGEMYIVASKSEVR